MKPRLKSLELHGYKTFAGRVLFEFPGNVTAIVGPNGSGKSNIADALRWVLGEQSYSLLRGKKTEDMIFLGSDQRPRAGMASAMITFDNEDNWLPIDYTDVAIARRAYRDGTNEYLINKQKVRLKDISELLAQSGLAERTYTIIGQGLVDAALSLRPEERRRFFEEAAGIGLFRSRREESLGRLDTTRRNLERANDILTELEPRMRSLERQAKRAEEYEHVKADLQVLLKDWYGFHWQNTQKELLRNREILKNQEEKVALARNRRLEIETKVESSRQRLQELRSLLNQLHTESAGYHNRREKASRELAVLEERLRSFQNQSLSLDSELVRNEEAVTGAADKLVDLVADKDRLAQELTDNREQLQAVQTQFSTRQAERSTLEQALNLKRRELVNSETRQVQLKAHQRELQSRLDTLAGSQASIHASLESLQTELAAAQSNTNAKRIEKENTSQKVAEIEEELKKVRDCLSGLEESERKQVGEKATLDAEILKVKAQLEVLIQAENALNGFGEGARNLITAARSGKLRGQFQAINALMEVPAGLEIAITAALGEQFDAILIGGETNTENILDFLKGTDAGRAILLPLEFHARIERVKTESSPDVMGVASELVTAQAGQKAVIERLLNNVMVVKNRQVARQLVEKLPFWAKVVTLEGEVYHGNGMITAGKEKRAGIITRPRQRKDLEDRIRQGEERQSQAQLALDELHSKVAAAIDKRKALEARLRGEQIASNAANSAYESAGRAITQLSQKLEWQNSQVGNLVAQKNAAETEMQSTMADFEQGAASVIALNTSLKELNDKLRLLPIDELQEQVVHWNTTLAVNERALKEAERRITENELLLSQNRSRVNQVKERINSLNVMTQNTDQDKTRLLKEEEEVIQLISLANEKIEPAESELSKLEIEYSQLQHDYTQVQQAETNAERVNTQAQLELGRSREALENLRHRIEDDFGLVALEYSEDISGPTPLPLEGVKQLVALTEIPKELEESINRQRSILRRMGAINTEAQKEYYEVKERFESLSSQMADLRKADEDLRQIILELDELMHKKFRETFTAVAGEFKQLFTRLFGGGSARLVLTDEDNPTETGIDIEAKLPGRREQGLSLLSGGERSLTAVALVFSLLKVSPTPFCVLDEVDAMLDEANVGRFTELLKELSQETQFIVITHNRNTVQVADIIYGVTMGRDSASQVISLRVDELSEEMVK